MAKWHKTPNGRIIMRGHSGRFRNTTLVDVGLAECRKCGEPFAPDFTHAYTPEGFVDPRKMQVARELCQQCMATEAESD